MVGALEDFRVSLQVIGDEVEPDEISSVLGSQPTTAYRKGDAIHGRDGTILRYAKSGSWSIVITSRDDDEPDFNSSLRELLDSLTDDLAIWRRLSNQFDTGLICGIFLTDSNRGFTISADLMSALGDRDLYLAMDVYGPD